MSCSKEQLETVVYYYCWYEEKSRCIQLELKVHNKIIGQNCKKCVFLLALYLVIDLIPTDLDNGYTQAVCNMATKADVNCIILFAHFENFSENFPKMLKFTLKFPENLQIFLKFFKILAKFFEIFLKFFINFLRAWCPSSVGPLQSRRGSKRGASASADNYLTF